MVDWFLSTAGLMLIGASAGAFIMAIFKTGAYDRGFEAGRDYALEVDSLVQKQKDQQTQ